MTVTLLYLHGVGQNVRQDQWLDGLNEARLGAGLDVFDIDARNVVAPDYVDLLKSVPKEKVDAPERTVHPKLEDAEWVEMKTAYARSQRRLADLAADDSVPLGFGLFGPKVSNFGANISPAMSDLKDAEAYLRDSNLRSAILQRVISQVGPRRELVVVGHSLGSLIAIDLLDHLPARWKIRRLITIGSPAGLMPMHKSQPQRLLKRFPLHQVESWANVMSPRDIVTGGRGLGYLFPNAHDIRIQLPMMTHGADAYLRHQVSAGLISDVTDPMESPAGSTSNRELAVRLTADEETVLLGLSFAHSISTSIRSKETKARFQTAVLDVQQGVSRLLIEKALLEKRPVSSTITKLLNDRRPPVTAATDEETALRALIVAATTNQIAPYEIDVAPAELNVIPLFWQELGFTTPHGEQIKSSLKSAMETFESSNLGRFALGAVGLAILAMGPIGLAVAAPAGLAGAAAITSALAAFGPGGMVGGMMLAGGLIGSGSVATTAALLARDSSSQVLETEVVRRMAISLSRKRIGLPIDYSNWLLFADVESQLAAEKARLSPLSDDSSPSARELKRKVKIIEKAIAWMIDHELAPTIEAD